MKINKILILSANAALMLLAGCAGGGDSSSPVDVSSEPTSSNPSSSDPSSSPVDSSSDLSDADLLALAEEAINTAIAKADSVSNGTIEYSYESPLYGSTDSDTIPFEFGTDENGDVLHYKRTQYYSTYDWYVMRDGNGDFVVVKKDEDDEISNSSYPSFEGIGFPYSNILDYSVYYFGTESLVENLFNIAKDNPNKDLVITHESDDQYSLSFGYLYTDEYDNNKYYKLELSFSIGSEGEFKTAKVSSTYYDSSCYNIDPEYDTVTLHSDAVAETIYTYDITQETGTRSFVNPYNPDGFYATSFDLVYEGETIASDSTIEIEAGESASISVENILPETTSFSFDDIDLSVTSGDEDGISASFSSWRNEISLYGYTAGEYTLEAKSKNVTKTFKVNCKPAAPESISLSYSTKGVDEYNSYVCDAEMDAYAGVEVVYQANVSPYAASQEVTASVTSFAADDYSFALKTVDINDWTSADCYCFTAKTAGDYKLKFVSADSSDVYTEVTVHVSATPTFAEVLADDYAAKARNANHDQEVRYYFSFTPTGTGETGSVTIEDRFNSKTEVASYSISQNGSNWDMTITHVSGDELGITLKIGSDYSLKMYESDDESGTGKLLSKADLAFMASGTYSGKSGDMSLYISLGTAYDLTFNMSNSDWTAYLYFDAKYELVSGNADTGYTCQIVESSSTEQDAFTLPLSFTLDKDLTTLGISFTYSGTTYTFSLTR